MKFKILKYSEIRVHIEIFKARKHNIPITNCTFEIYFNHNFANFLTFYIVMPEKCFSLQ